MPKKKKKELGELFHTKTDYMGKHPKIFLKILEVDKALAVKYYRTKLISPSFNCSREYRVKETKDKMSIFIYLVKCSVDRLGRVSFRRSFFSKYIFDFKERKFYHNNRKGGIKRLMSGELNSVVHRKLAERLYKIKPNNVLCLILDQGNSKSRLSGDVIVDKVFYSDAETMSDVVSMISYFNEQRKSSFLRGFGYNRMVTIRKNIKWIKNIEGNLPKLKELYDPWANAVRLGGGPFDFNKDVSELEDEMVSFVKTHIEIDESEFLGTDLSVPDDIMGILNLIDVTPIVSIDAYDQSFDIVDRHGFITRHGFDGDFVMFEGDDGSKGILYRHDSLAAGFKYIIIRLVDSVNKISEFTGDWVEVSLRKINDTYPNSYVQGRSADLERYRSAKALRDVVEVEYDDELPF